MRALYVVVALSTLLIAGPAEARDRIRVVGSASAIGLIQPAAESFSSHWQQDMPALEVTGAALGFGLFCAGVGFEHPDAMVTFRAITPGELSACGKNGVAAVTQIEIGRDAAVLAGNPPIDVTRSELFAAVAARVDRGGALAANPNTRWVQVRAELPDQEILVMAPEPNTSASHAFQTLALAEGCKGQPAIMALDQDARDRACLDLRKDGRVVSAAKREREVIGWLESNPGAYAVTAYSNLVVSDERISVSALEGVAPTPQTLANARYPLTTTLYLYVKDAHLRPIPGIQQFVYELTSERAIAPEGYLAERGLIPLDDVSRNWARDQALRLGL
jgi:phosphate transport system substrate-binding protein